MKKKISESVVLISGGSAGIGKAIGSMLIHSGATVVNADVNIPPENYHAYSKYHFCRTDVCNAKQVELLHEFMLSQTGLPDTVVCCAGIRVHETIADGDPEKWKRVLDVNVMGVLRLLRGFLYGLEDSGNSDVVLISSVSAHQPYAYGSVYTASKSALHSIAETLRIEQKNKVRVTVIEPGWVDTAFLTLNDPENKKPDALDPSEIAKAVLFALEADSDVEINQIRIRPRGQTF